MSIRRQSRRTREPFPVPQTPGIYKQIAYSFVGLTVLIVIVALYFSSVRATVLITPAKEQTDIQLDVPISKEPAQGEIGGRVLRVSSDEVTQEFAVNTGEAREEIGTSTGNVKITNTYSSPQPLVKTTRLLTADGKLYRIAEGVTVPAGGSVTVGAYADQDGASFDFTNKTTFTIPGLSESMQKFVTAVSISPFEGGRRLIRSLGQQDIDAAKQTLQNSIEEEMKQKIKDAVNDTRYSESVFSTDGIEVNMTAKAGDQTDHFLMSMKLNMTGVFYSKADLDALLQQKVPGLISSGKKIISKDLMNRQDSVKDADASSEHATVSVKAQVLTIPVKTDGLISKEGIAGLPIDEAEKKLQATNGVEDAQITIRPSWVRRLPTMASRISVKIKQ